MKKTYERLEYACVTISGNRIYFNRPAADVLPNLGWAGIRMAPDVLIFEFYDRPLRMGERLLKVDRRPSQMSVYKPSELSSRIRDGKYQLYTGNGMFYIYRYERRNTNENGSDQELLQVR